MAVGLTPEMLPMIVTVCLSKGALAFLDPPKLTTHQAIAERGQRCHGRRQILIPHRTL